jgi:hypothetical protein
MSALQVETDSQNTHMLLGALLLCVQDSVTHEEADTSDGQSTSAPETNLLSSGNFNILSYFCIVQALLVHASTLLSLLLIYLIFSQISTFLHKNSSFDHLKSHTHKIKLAMKMNVMLKNIKLFSLFGT